MAGRRIVLSHMETREVRDLAVLAIPFDWAHLDNDDQIKARVVAEITLMFLTEREVQEVSGRQRDVPRTLGVVRDFEITLVRKPSDAWDIKVDHSECEECGDMVKALGMMPESTLTFCAVAQFTFDEIVSVVVDDAPEASSA